MMQKVLVQHDNEHDVRLIVLMYGTLPFHSLYHFRATYQCRIWAESCGQERPFLIWRGGAVYQ